MGIFRWALACVASVPTKRTKFGPREGVFRIRAARKIRWKERGGAEGERRERLPANPLILKLKRPLVFTVEFLLIDNIVTELKSQ